ncbi:acyltransferase family protein [Rhizobium tumorigenes]|uniref:Acyltransferase family protein n=1 Tax=Rhizobium tumorigenes TaxID=2041385 RepID=A0AAF1K853_9HYPH|nr:acyltransferase family protein [Rhizobium tumorigenes]WFR97738.1 acyltransferase family protein [Rhizobium tumorigenes]
MSDKLALAVTKTNELRTQHDKTAVSLASTKGIYRPDIDGLRALAVSIVLIYHTGITGLRGGFIGVDVFFVISGFLITSLLRSDLEQNTFSIVRFYERRVRRIFPALIAVIAVTLAVAPVVLFPVEIRTTALTAITALSSFSNIYLLNSAGYFGADVNSQPLIHTWSLGVEEQFYLAFPLVLAVVGTSRPRKAFWVIAGLALASLIGGILLTTANRDVAYYFPLTRAWELLVGSLLAYRGLPLMPRIFRELGMLAAVVLLLACSLKFHSGLAFPGYYAVIPCLTAAVLIGVGGQGPSIVKSLLSAGPVVWVGKISYSLYLWHWPIFIYYQLARGTALSAPEALGLVAASIVTAYLSWRYIEQPFRERKIAGNRTALFAWAGTAYMILCAGSVLLYSNILTITRGSEADRLASYIDYDDTPTYRRGVCFLLGHLNSLSDYDRDTCLKPSIDKPNLLLVGDSHAADLWSGLHAVLPQENVMQATSSGCKPVIVLKGERGCTDLMQMVFNDFLKTHHPETLVLSARWIASDIPDLVKTIEALRSKAGRIVVFGPIVEYVKPLPRLLAQVAGGRDESLLVSARNFEQVATDEGMAAAVNAAGGSYISTYGLLCPTNGAVCTTEQNGVPLQWDYGHLTAEGSKVVAQQAISSSPDFFKPTSF